MKIKNLLLFLKLTFCFYPLYAWDFNYTYNLEETKREIKTILVNEHIKAAEKEMLDALNAVTKESNPKTTMEFGAILREKIKILPPKIRPLFLKFLRNEARKLDVLSKLDWYFLTEEGLAKKDFTAITVTNEAEKLANNLFNALNGKSPHKLELITRTAKTDIIKLTSQADHNLIETFFHTFTKSAKNYGVMSRSLKLFLKQLANDELPVKLVYEGINPAYAESMARNTMPAIMRNFTWQEYVINNQNIILKDLFKSGRFYLSDWSNIIAGTYTSQTLSNAEKQMASKISILEALAKQANPRYQQVKSNAIKGFPGQRVILREQALELDFGELTTANAKTLYKMAQDVPAAKLTNLAPTAKGWLESFSKWAQKSIKPKSGTILTLGATIGIIYMEELIRNYTNYNPSTIYLSIIDEIIDSLADGNTLKLVYNTVFDERFAQSFIIYDEEGNLTTEEQLAFIETYNDFETAVYATFFQGSEENIGELSWQCFALNENCSEA